MLHLMFVAVQFVVQRRVHVQWCGGHRVYRDRDCRQNFVFGGPYVSVEIAVIAVGQAMAAVVAAENNRVAARQRGAEEDERLKGTIRDRKSLWENEIVSKELCQGLVSVSS